MEKIKTPILFIVTVFTVAFLWAFISTNSYRSKATIDHVSVYFGNESYSGNELKLPIIIESETTQKVSSAKIIVNYDTAHLEPMIYDESDSTCQKLGTTLMARTSSASGTFTIARVSNLVADQLPSGIFCFGTLKFRMIASGTATLSINSSAAHEVVGPGPKAYTVQTTTNSTKTVTITSSNLTPLPTQLITTSPSPTTGNVTLNLKLKLQGVVKKPASGQETQTVKVKIVDVSGNTASGSGQFTADDNGIWIGSITTNVATGSGYKVFVKGPKHLQKRVCVATPTETYPGSYHCDQGGITITAGQNTFDFSGVYMLVGDLPEQDGVVNSYDTSLIRNNLGKSDADTLSKADLNFDGIVDTQDYSLIISALSVRGDEGE